MSDRIITQERAEKQKRLMELLKGVTDISDEELRKLIYFCYEKYDSTYQELGDVLGKSKQYIEKKFPKVKEVRS